MAGGRRRRLARWSSRVREQPDFSTRPRPRRPPVRDARGPGGESRGPGLRRRRRLDDARARPPRHASGWTRCGARSAPCRPGSERWRPAPRRVASSSLGPRPRARRPPERIVAALARALPDERPSRAPDHRLQGRRHPRDAAGGARRHGLGPRARTAREGRSLREGRPRSRAAGRRDPHDRERTMGGGATMTRRSLALVLLVLAAVVFVTLVLPARRARSVAQDEYGLARAERQRLRGRLADVDRRTSEEQGAHRRRRGRRGASPAAGGPRRDERARCLRGCGLDEHQPRGARSRPGAGWSPRVVSWTRCA